MKAPSSSEKELIMYLARARVRARVRAKVKAKVKVRVGVRARARVRAHNVPRCRLGQVRRQRQLRGEALGDVGHDGVVVAHE